MGTHPITAVYSGDSNFSTSTSSPVSETVGSGTQVVDLSSYYNLTGITTDGTSFSGGLDGNGNAFSETEVGRSLAWNGLTFPLAAPNVNNVVEGGAPAIALPTGTYSSLSILATATNGNQPGQVFTVTYSNGGTQTFTQSISDWHTPQNYPGESIALTTEYRNTSSGGRDTAPRSPSMVIRLPSPFRPRDGHEHHAARQQPDQGFVDHRRGTRCGTDRCDGHGRFDHLGRLVVGDRDRRGHRLQHLSGDDGGRRVGDADRDIAADRHELYGLRPGAR